MDALVVKIQYQLVTFFLRLQCAFRGVSSSCVITRPDCIIDTVNPVSNLTNGKRLSVHY